MRKEHPIKSPKETHEVSPFYVAKLTNATLSHGPLGPSLQVVLDSKAFMGPGEPDENNRSRDPWIISLTAGKNPAAGFVQRALEKFQKGEDVILADRTHPIRWLGSGGLLLIADRRQTYAIINRRDKSFILEGRYDANGGLSSTEKELISPSTLAERELGEEIIIDSSPVTTLHPLEAPLTRPCSTTISFNGRQYYEDGLILAVDPKTGTIDFRKVFTMHLKDISKSTFLDGEAADRPVLAVPARKLIQTLKSRNPTSPYLGFINGRKISAKELEGYQISGERLTPALRTILETIQHDINFPSLV